MCRRWAEWLTGKEEEISAMERPMRCTKKAVIHQYQMTPAGPPLARANLEQREKGKEEEEGEEGGRREEEKEGEGREGAVERSREISGRRRRGGRDGVEGGGTDTEKREGLEDTQHEVHNDPCWATIAECEQGGVSNQAAKGLREGGGGGGGRNGGWGEGEREGDQKHQLNETGGVREREREGVGTCRVESRRHDAHNKLFLLTLTHIAAQCRQTRS